MIRRRPLLLITLLTATAVSQSGCVAIAITGAAVETAGAVVSGAAKVGGKAVAATGRAIVPGDSRKDRDQ